MSISGSRNRFSRGWRTVTTTAWAQAGLLSLPSACHRTASRMACVTTSAARIPTALSSALRLPVERANRVSPSRRVWEGADGAGEAVVGHGGDGVGFRRREGRVGGDDADGGVGPGHGRHAGLPCLRSGLDHGAAGHGFAGGRVDDTADGVDHHQGAHRCAVRQPGTRRADAAVGERSGREPCPRWRRCRRRRGRWGRAHRWPPWRHGSPWPCPGGPAGCRRPGRRSRRRGRWGRRRGRWRNRLPALRETA